MRVLLLIVMIALLPLRGWVGDAMAIDMAVQQSRMTLAATGEPMPENCAMNTQSQSDMLQGVESPQPDADTPSCNCNVCDLCLAMASLHFFSPAAAAFIAHDAPPARGTRFSSAERGLSHKPPIS